MKKFLLLFFVLLSCFICCWAETNENDSLTMKLLGYDHFHKGDSFDSSTNEITLLKGGDDCAFLSLNKTDAEENNCLEIKYSNASTPFYVRVRYFGVIDNPASVIVCTLKDGVGYIPLNDELKNKIYRLEVINKSKNHDLFVKIDSLKYVYKTLVQSPVVDKGPAVPFNSEISAIDFVKQMKAGWNLGDNFDTYGDFFPKASIESEMSWGEPYITEEIVGIGKKNGMNTIRIPVTWYNHIIDKNYTIDPVWMQRVKTVVDWAIADGYYVIINDHLSAREGMVSPIPYGDGYNVSVKDRNESEAFLKAIWTQISIAFNNSYDEHLIFETMNEPRDYDKNHTGSNVEDHWYYPGLKTNFCDTSKCKSCLADYEVLNEYNQICLNAIRATGGNNAKRFVMIPALSSGIAEANHKLFRMPNDQANDKLILTVHDYDGLGYSAKYAKIYFTNESKLQMEASYKKLNKKFISNGIPVIVGETSAANVNPLESRIKWITAFGTIAKKYGMSILYFDYSNTTSDNSPSIFDRDKGCVRPEQQEFVDAFVKSME